MKRGVIGKLFFVTFLLIFLSYGIFAAGPAAGTCAIVPRADCGDVGINIVGNHILFGASAATNAHGQVFPYNDYPYVLCCGFGLGNTTCTTAPSNKVIGLSSLTNAHAEAPSLNNYQTAKVCYDDLICVSQASSICPTNYKGILSLSSDPSNPTNAHIGNFGDYPTKICCGGISISRLTCTVKSATWNVQNAIENQTVYMNIVGSGTECDGISLNVQILGPNPTKTNGTSVTFQGSTAISSWKAEWQQASFLGGDASYKFNVSTRGLAIISSAISSSPDLTVKKTNIINYCSTNYITDCSGYTDMGTCQSDNSLCNVSKDSSLPGVDCTSPSITCKCAWDNSSKTCGFSYSQIKTGLCNSSYTLCHDNNSGIDYCGPPSCPGSQASSCNNNGICDPGEGCTCADCNGKQDSCVIGATCSGGICSGTVIPTNTEIRCNYGFTLCQEPISKMNYCYPGNACPSGQNPTDNNNGKCEIGEGCLSPHDCKDGSQDSCVSGTYCSLGKCSSVLNPISAGLSGGCTITQTVKKTCDQEPVGYKVLSWTGTWTGDKSGSAYQACIAGGETTVPCPAQVQLPFFDYWELGIAIVVIALIYIFLSTRKKTKRKKRR